MLIYLFIHEHRVESMKTEFFSVQETNTLRLFQRKKNLFRLVFLELKWYFLLIADYKKLFPTEIYSSYIDTNLFLFTNKKCF